MSEAVQSTQDSKPGQPAVQQPWYLTRWMFIRLIGVINLTAFGSYAVQIIQLNGSHGVMPTAELLRTLPDFDAFQRFLMMPTMAWLECSDQFLQWQTIVGSLLSVSITLGIFSGPCLALCTVLWLSLVAGGGEFTNFQSDGMLVEANLLSLFVVSWAAFEPPWMVKTDLCRQHLPLPAGILLLRFMIFRIMLASGLIKLASGDPYWASLTALNYHFETQPLPTPLAWYFDHLPQWVLSGFVLSMFASEIIAPLFVFGPRLLRLISAVLMAGLQVMIILTGNYTFLNYLLIVLCIPVLDDTLTGQLIPERARKTIRSSVQFDFVPSKAGKAVVTVLASVMIFLAGSQFVNTFIRVPVMRSVLMLIAQLHIADNYGLFAVMTVKRPEIVFEGSDDGRVWQPYVMRWKVDDPHEAPPWVAPHMPRLPWRLWFAAMDLPPLTSAEALETQREGSFEVQQGWVLSLVYRMLQGQSEVLKAFEKDPFPSKPPKYMRAWVYQYHFTDKDQRAKNGDWWWRDQQREYLAPLTLIDGKLAQANLP
jgi:hypothetical protein